MNRVVDKHFGVSPQTSAGPIGAPPEPFVASLEEKLEESPHPPLRRLQSLGSSRNVGDVKPWEIGAAGQKVRISNHPRPQDVWYLFDTYTRKIFGSLCVLSAKHPKCLILVITNAVNARCL